MKNRKDEMQKLRTKGLKLAQIGKLQKPPISSERVRQILQSDERQLCKKHNIMFAETCKYCEIETTWQGGLKDYTRLEIETELKKLSKKGRDAVSSLKRKILIKKLIKEHGVSFSELSRFMGKHRTTVSHYFYSK
jgi:hypothetical protein